MLQSIVNIVSIVVLGSDHVSSGGQKSQERCNEYAKFVYTDENIPVLRMDTGTNTVSECGIVEVPLIVGGVKAKPKEFPHTAVIGYGNSDDDISWQCGGTLISESFVLTAAHCAKSQDKGPASRIRAGLTNLKDPEHTMQERKIANRIVHPKYKPPSRYHDIALFKVISPFDLNADVRPACLNTDAEIPGTSAIASGFGKTAYDQDSISDDLLKVQLNYYSNKECEENFKADINGKSLPEGLTQNLLCVGEMAGGKDTCQGDSGGPLQRILSEPYCMYSIVGTTSFGKYCGFKNSPAIYTRVSAYIDWIEDVVWP